MVDEKCIQNFGWGNPKRGDHLKEDRKIIFECVLGK
jgi:hypothetical protein